MKIRVIVIIIIIVIIIDIIIDSMMILKINNREGLSVTASFSGLKREKKIILQTWKRFDILGLFHILSIIILALMRLTI